MARPKKRDSETFGARLAALRRARGLSQRDLAPQLGISQRMLAYYEAQTDRPPAHLLDKITSVLRVSADELLGIKSGNDSASQAAVNTRLMRRLRQIEQLPPAERKAILKILDGLLERQKLSTARS